MGTDFEGGSASLTTTTQWRTDQGWSNAEAFSASELDYQLRDRVIVLAAHPDDETLGAAGLMDHAHRAGRDVQLVLVTAGEASHPDSTTHSPTQMRSRRLDESARALRVVAPGASTVFLGVADGHVTAHQDEVCARLVDLIGDGRDCTVVSPWRGDGHPDHEAVARAASLAAWRTDANHWEYPIWFWHWGSPRETPWEDLFHIRLDDRAQHAKREAVACHLSQIADLSARPGDETLLTGEFLGHFDGQTESFFRGPGEDQALEQLHQRSTDPWGTDRDWFEERKREVILSLLPRRRFRFGLELGCSTGTLARSLAPRCDRLTAIDSSPSALKLAAERSPEGVARGTIHYELRNVPAEWPTGEPDLVVISELAYFLSVGELELLNLRTSSSIAEDGVIVLCNWRHPIDGWPLDGPAVHSYFRRHALWPEAASYQDEDFEVSIFCAPATMPVPRS